MVPCKSTAEEVSFEWSHHRISSTDSNVRTTLHVFVIDSWDERANTYFKNRPYVYNYLFPPPSTIFNGTIDYSQSILSFSQIDNPRAVNCVL